MTAQTLTLTSFLLARIAEDEAAVRAPYKRSPIGRRALGHRATSEAFQRVSELHDARMAVRRAPDDSGLRTLALPYADHPDYNPDWRP